MKAREKEYTERVDFPKGEPENPLTDEEFRIRDEDLMEYAGVEASVREEVFRMVHQENVTVEELVRNL